MAHTRPGTYILYKDNTFQQPTCPGIVYTDDLAPLNVQRNRPLSGYVSLVLLIAEPFQFRWATTGQLSPLFSLEESGLAMRPHDELHACETATFWRDAGVGLDFWRSQVDADSILKSEEGPGEDSYGDDDGEYEQLRKIDYESGTEEDEQMREALRLSLEHHDNTARSQLVAPSTSPPEADRPRNQSGIITIADEYSDNYDLYTRPPKKNRHQTLPKHSHDLNLNGTRAFSPTSSGDERLSGHCVKGNGSKKKKGSRTRFSSGRMGLDQLLGRSSLGQRSTAPTSDIIEGRLSESKDFVKVPVGSSGEIRNFLKKDVWNRPYFQDSRTGVNHFRLAEDNTWELRHPQLAHVEIDDFQFIAEYLTDGEFGLRNPEGPEQNKEAIAQCVAAWETAEKLSMDDMLEHIAEKVKFLEWDNEDVLTLAILVYRSSGPSLHAHELLKDWISSFLAHHFWTYIKDEAIGHYFRKRLRKLPELERDVFEKRATSLRTGADPDEDEESDEGGLDEDDL